MVTVGIMPIDLGWPSTMPSQPCLGDDKYIPQLQKAVTAMHAAGAKVSFQPWMPGRAPYTYADAVERAQDIAIVNKLTKDEILNIERKYVAACLRCAACGVDAIEWHNAHNYLGEQFFSPYFNHRTDEYGQQNVENSMRFARECISKARPRPGRGRLSQHRDNREAQRLRHPPRRRDPGDPGRQRQGIGEGRRGHDNRERRRRPHQARGHERRRPQGRGLEGASGRDRQGGGVHPRCGERQPEAPRPMSTALSRMAAATWSPWAARPSRTPTGSASAPPGVRTSSATA